jgi:CBS domain-containing protein
MASTPQGIRADASTGEALQVMAERDLGALPVLDGGRFIGIFSERDHARSCTRQANEGMTTPVREVMTPCDGLASLTDSVQECLHRMTEKHLRYLPVQVEGGAVALLSIDDLLGEMVTYLERVCREKELDQQVAALRGTYSC